MAIIAHLHDPDGSDVGYVCGPGSCDFVVRIHRRGAKRYEIVSWHRSEVAAFKAMAEAVSKGRQANINRGDVLAVERELSYYDPIVICELRV